MHSRRTPAIVFCAIALLTARDVLASFRLAPVFSDNMVLQRDQPLRVWGDAEAGAAVEVRLGSDSVTAKTDAAGHWSGVLPSQHASLEPHTLVVKSDGEEKTISNVLIGDVWLCAGQSNMQMTLAETDTGPQEVKDAAKQTRIRLLTVPKKFSSKTETTFNAKWQTCSPQSAAKFSAVGYYFGRALADDPALRDVPIGLIDCSFGGTAAEAWISPDKLTDIKKDELLPSLFGIAPGQIYNAMVSPLIPLNVTGVLWYQGESNASKPELYPRVLSTMIDDWRQRLQSPKLPFFIVQLPAFIDTKFVWIREAEARVARDVPGVHLAITYDTTDGFDLHPHQKRPIGHRLALLARNAIYHEAVAATGPIFKSATLDGPSIRVAFNTFGHALTARGDSLRGFALAGEDGAFRFANATIAGDQVLLHSDSVPSPKYLRYAWSGIPDANLTDDQGLPAAPFRTDSFPRDLIEVQNQPTSRQITTPAYHAEIDGGGKVTSLVVANRQFLSNQPGAAGGTSVPGFLGPRSLPNIQSLGPDLLTCSDTDITLTLRFHPNSMTWNITNRSNGETQFHIALAPRVAVENFTNADTPFTLKSQKALLIVKGVDSAKHDEDGSTLIVAVKPGKSREISFETKQ